MLKIRSRNLYGFKVDVFERSAAGQIALIDDPSAGSSKACGLGVAYSNSYSAKYSLSSVTFPKYPSNAEAGFGMDSPGELCLPLFCEEGKLSQT
jgi:hypothetical protein